MSIPLKWNDYLLFREEVLNERRCLRNDRINSYLGALKDTCKKRIITIAQNTELWRARLEGAEVPNMSDDIDDMSLAAYSCDDMTAPPSNESRASRVGVKGIPVLYLSSDKDTAMSEVRPWKAQPVSLAQFHAAKDLNVVDCQQAGLDGTIADLDRLWPVAFLSRRETIPACKQKEIAWAWIDHAFSEPVSQSDDPLAYIPTQVIAELFKTEGYDGIKYQSSVASGHNVALFDVNAAKVVETKLYFTNDICYRFSMKQFPK